MLPYDSNAELTKKRKKENQKNSNRLSSGVESYDMSVRLKFSRFSFLYFRPPTNERKKVGPIRVTVAERR